MRFLHTSDWHLGHSLHNHSREYEHRQFLSWLLDTLESQRVDALLIAGDIFDSANPPASALHQWYSFLATFRLRFPTMHLVAIGGNHDSPQRLDATAPLLTELRLHVVGGFPQKTPVRAAIPLHGPDGSVQAWVIAMPFLRAYDFVGIPGDASTATAFLYSKVVDYIPPQPGAPILAMGHAHLAATIPSEDSERRLVGFQDALSTSIFPERVGYTALGHLHLAQSVGSPSVQYSGSPLPLSMSERTYTHQVLIIDFEGEHLRHVEGIAVPRTVPFLSFPETGFATTEMCLDFLRSSFEPVEGIPLHLHPFLELRLVRETSISLQKQRLRQEAEKRAVRWVRPIFGPVPAEESLELPSLERQTPEDIFALKVKRDTGKPPSPELLATFRQLLAEVETST